MLVTTHILPVLIFAFYTSLASGWQLFPFWYQDPTVAESEWEAYQEQFGEVRMLEGARAFIRRNLRDVSEFEARLRHLLRLDPEAKPGPWDVEAFRSTRELHTSRRRRMIVRCCERRTCWPGRSANKRRNRVAYAQITGDGVTVTCPECPDGWQNDLDWNGENPGGIPVICNACPSGWQQQLNLTGMTSVIAATQTTKLSNSTTTTTVAAAAATTTTVAAAAATTAAAAATTVAAAATTVAAAAAATTTTVAAAAATTVAAAATTAAATAAATAAPTTAAPTTTTTTVATTTTTVMATTLVVIPDMFKNMIPAGISAADITYALYNNKMPPGVTLPPGMTIEQIKGMVG